MRLAPGCPGSGWRARRGSRCTGRERRGAGLPLRLGPQLWLRLRLSLLRSRSHASPGRHEPRIIARTRARPGLGEQHPLGPRASRRARRTEQARDAGDGLAGSARAAGDDRRAVFARRTPGSIASLRRTEPVEPPHLDRDRARAEAERTQPAAGARGRGRRASPPALSRSVRRSRRTASSWIADGGAVSATGSLAFAPRRLLQPGGGRAPTSASSATGSAEWTSPSVVKPAFSSAASR